MKHGLIIMILLVVQLIHTPAFGQETTEYPTEKGKFLVCTQQGKFPTVGEDGSCVFQEDQNGKTLQIVKTPKGNIRHATPSGSGLVKKIIQIKNHVYLLSMLEDGSIYKYDPKKDEFALEKTAGFRIGDVELPLLYMYTLLPVDDEDAFAGLLSWNPHQGWVVNPYNGEDERRKATVIEYDNTKGRLIISHKARTHNSWDSSGTTHFNLKTQEFETGFETAETLE